MSWHGQSGLGTHLSLAGVHLPSSSFAASLARVRSPWADADGAGLTGCSGVPVVPAAGRHRTSLSSWGETTGSRCASNETTQLVLFGHTLFWAELSLAFILPDQNRWRVALWQPVLHFPSPLNTLVYLGCAGHGQGEGDEIHCWERSWSCCYSPDCHQSPWWK